MEYTAIIIGLLTIFGIANAGETTSVMSPDDDNSLLRKTRDKPLSGIGTYPARRLVVSDQECTLYKMSTEYGESIEDNGDGVSRLGRTKDKEEEWHCELDKEYARETLGLEDPLIQIIGWTPKQTASEIISDDRIKYEDKDEDDFDMLERVESGESTMKFSKAIIDLVDNTMFVDSASVSVVSNTKRESSEVIPKVGIKRTLVVRILADDGSFAPKVTADQLKKSLFENPISLKQKYEECSYNKLKIQPFRGTTTTNQYVEDGIVDVRLNRRQSNEVKRQILNNGGKIGRDRINSFARIRAAALLGDLKSQFDLVLFDLPEGIMGFMAVAVTNRYDSYYTGSWISRPSFPLHEVGHNLGMEHAGESDIYDDKVGYMGFSYDNLDGPNMCFNPANSYYLGWYQKQTDSYNANESGTGKRFYLNGVNAYKPRKSGSGDEKRLVVLQLSQAQRDWDYYIGYNQQKGMNDGTSENENHILIVKKLGPADRSAKTKKVGTLSTVGAYYEIEQYNLSLSVYILFESRSADGEDVVIKVSTVRPKPVAMPTAVPTAVPTRPLTSSPTTKPTAQLTTQPTTQPATQLTPSPTRNSTPAPTSKSTRPLTSSPTTKPATQLTPSPTRNSTPAPTSKPTTKNGLYDRDDFRYRGRKTADCQWVAKKLGKRCRHWEKYKAVKTYWCPKTCENTSSLTNFTNCSEEDRDNLAFRKNPAQNCDWVSTKKKRRCAKTWKRKKISKFWCPETCNGLCEV